MVNKAENTLQAWNAHGLSLLGKSDDHLLSCGFAVCLQNEHLSLLGKVMIIYSLVGSLFVYKMNILFYARGLPYKVRQPDASLLWNNKRPKIKLQTRKACKEDGGLKLVDLKAKEISKILLGQNILSKCHYKGAC